MTISAEVVSKLRVQTGAGIMDCKRALQEAEGDFEKAVVILREKGLAAAARKADRVASEGLIGSYVHMGGKLGVLVEVNCETDFVSRTSEFQELVKDISMQIAAANPLYIQRNDISPEVIEKERAIYRTQAMSSGKSEKVLEKIVDGKMEKYYQEVCLMDQPFIKDPNIKIKDYLCQKIAQLGENIVVARFVRYRLGEERKK